MICLIAAIGKNNAVGLDNQMLWHLPEDFKWFKSTTMNRPIIMGRKTFQSIGRILPGRLSIVISRTPQENQENVKWVNSLEDAISTAKNATDYKNDEIIIIGGGEIYKQALPLANRLYLTEVDLSPEADAFFPAFDKSNWQEKVIAEHTARDDKPAFIIKQYDRI